MATTGFTVFVTYQFEGAPYSADTTYGYSDAIHCNYVTKIETDVITNKGINLYFTNNEFPFLVQPSASTTGYGWSAYRMYAIAQIVNGTGDEIKPNSWEWRKLDVTNQINNHTVGDPISAESVAASLISFSQLEYSVAPVYDLSYLNYPTSGTTDDNKLAFGEEVFFFGNVSTDIKAVAYTTDIPIVLPLNQYNTSTNPTWDGASSVEISEIGIYDENDNLVAIGKLNQPITKDSTISRTIVFAMDF